MKKRINKIIAVFSVLAFGASTGFAQNYVDDLYYNGKNDKQQKNATTSVSQETKAMINGSYTNDNIPIINSETVITAPEDYYPGMFAEALGAETAVREEDATPEDVTIKVEYLPSWATPDITVQTIYHPSWFMAGIAFYVPFARPWYSDVFFNGYWGYPWMDPIAYDMWYYRPWGYPWYGYGYYNPWYGYYNPWYWNNPWYGYYPPYYYPPHTSHRPRPNYTGERRISNTGTYRSTASTGTRSGSGTYRSSGTTRPGSTINRNDYNTNKGSGSSTGSSRNVYVRQADRNNAGTTTNRVSSGSGSNYRTGTITNNTRTVNNTGTNVNRTTTNYNRGSSSTSVNRSGSSSGNTYRSTSTSNYNRGTSTYNSNRSTSTSTRSSNTGTSRATYNRGSSSSTSTYNRGGSSISRSSTTSTSRGGRR